MNKEARRIKASPTKNIKIKTRVLEKKEGNIKNSTKIKEERISKKIITIKTFFHFHNVKVIKIKMEEINKSSCIALKP